MAKNTKGIICEIERYAVNDGPGIRTVVFFKGCPLRCKWCANPETQTISPQIMYWQTRCIGCKMCIGQCPHHALRWGDEGIEITRTQCVACGACADACNSQALTLSGKERNVSDVLTEVLNDRAFFDSSGGGVTFSGGEATLQKEFLFELAKACKNSGLHTCIETCGFADWSTFEKIAEYIDLFLFDIKTSNPEVHQEFTGVSNELILENFSKLNRSGANMVARIPVIPGVNNSEENFRDIIAFLKAQAHPCPVSLLPYHPLGVSKYKKLDMGYWNEALKAPSTEEMQKYADYFRSSGFAVSIGE